MWNLCAQSDAADVIATLESSDFLIREVDTTGVRSAEDFRTRCGETFGFQAGGWDSFADDMWMALLPDDDETKVAFAWYHADALLDDNLGVLLTAMDLLTTIGRAAYTEGIEVITFAFGHGPNFPPVDLADMFPITE